MGQSTILLADPYHNHIYIYTHWYNMIILLVTCAIMIHYNIILYPDHIAFLCGSIWSLLIVYDRCSVNDHYISSYNKHNYHYYRHIQMVIIHYLAQWSIIFHYNPLIMFITNPLWSLLSIIFNSDNNLHLLLHTIILIHYCCYP